jgi:hypothetical protein
MSERDEGYAEPGDLDDEPDFAEEHQLIWVEADARRDTGETESPRGHAGLEPTMRPN